MRISIEFLGGKMASINVIETSIADLVIIEPTVFGDSRGYFLETYQKDIYKLAGINANFVQDNESKSVKGVLRGLHFQINNPQGKLVRVISGSVYDVAVDLRRRSETYGKWEGVVLSGDNKKMLYIPPGFAHGFLVLSDEAIFSYKCTEVYDANSDSGIYYNDPDIGIAWPIDGLENIQLSDKDKNLMALKAFNTPF
jgi:dTDP-4-dehydrorhamnose 3,5-epimerase